MNTAKKGPSLGTNLLAKIQQNFLKMQNPESTPEDSDEEN